MVHLKKLNLRNMHLNNFAVVLWVSHFHIYKPINYDTVYFYNITSKYSFTSNYSVHNEYILILNPCLIDFSKIVLIVINNK